jgi:hypothetical protein
MGRHGTERQRRPVLAEIDADPTGIFWGWIATAG